MLTHKIDDDLGAIYNRHDYLKQCIPVISQWENYLEEYGLIKYKTITY
ncbi:hypothetical protein [Vespertiliibacter pulmonis]|nr:hypothetical protein [Vespertiliibacter pulmonis]